MEASTNNTKNTTANVLIYEPVPPINPSNKEGQVSTNPINPSGSLAEQAGPGLSTRQVQPIYALFDKYKSDAHQLLKEGKITEASEIYISLAENLELKLKKRLNCAKRLLEINTQAPQTAQTKEYIVKAANILVEIAKDDRIHGPTRLKALRSIAETKGLEERALEIFSTLFKFPVLSDWIQDAAGNCIAPLLLAKAQDLQLWPLERIDAAKKLAQINGQVEKAAELLIAIAQDNNYHSVYRKKAAKLVSKLKGQEAQNRGKELLKAIKIEDLVRKSLSKDKKQANRCYAADYISDRYYAAEKLSKTPGQEKNAAEVLKSISDDKQLPLAYRIEAAERLSAITQGRELVEFLFSLVQDPTVLSLNRFDAAEKLSKIVGEEEQALAWSYLIKEKGIYHLNIYNGIKAAERLSKIPGHQNKAIDYLFCIIRNRGIEESYAAKAIRILATIPGQEKYAVELLLSRVEKADYIDRYRFAKILSRIPGQEENLATIRLGIAQWNSIPTALLNGAEMLSRMPGQTENTKAAFLSIAEKKAIRRDIILQYRVTAPKALFEHGDQEDKEKAVELLKTFVDNEQENLENRIQAAKTLEALLTIPKQTEQAKTLLTGLIKTHVDLQNRIQAAKDLLTGPGQKAEAESLLKIAKDGTVPVLDRFEAARILAETKGQEPKAAEALIHMGSSYDAKELDKYDHIRAAENLSKIPGYEAKAREIVDKYLFPISDESRYFKF